MVLARGTPDCILHRLPDEGNVELNIDALLAGWFLHDIDMQKMLAGEIGDKHFSALYMNTSTLLLISRTHTGEIATEIEGRAAQLMADLDRILSGYRTPTGIPRRTVRALAASYRGVTSMLEAMYEAEGCDAVYMSLLRHYAHGNAGEREYRPAVH